MSISRRMRSLLAAALTTGALFALPGAAFAAPVVTATVTKDAATSIDPGVSVKYSVVISTDTNTTAAGTINVSPSNYRDSWNGAALVSGGAVTDPGFVAPTFAVDFDGDGVDVTIPAGFTAADPITVQFDVRLPARVVDQAPPMSQTGFKVKATSPIFAGFTTTALSAESAPTDVYKGDGTKKSKLYITAGETTSNPAGLGNWWAPLNSTTSTTFTIHNWGDGDAYQVQMYSSANPSASPVQPAKPKADSPDFDWLTDLDVKTTAVGGDCADLATTTSANDCVIETIPAGGSKTVTVSATGLTHLGMTVQTTASFNGQGYERQRSYSEPRWNDGDDYSASVSAAEIQVTDGKTVLPKVVVDGPRLAASRTDVTYNVEISNGGPDAITNGVLRVGAPVYDDKGNEVGSAYIGDEKRVASLKSVNIPGVTCGESKNDTFKNYTTGKFESKTRMSIADCSIANLPSGARLVGTVIANFPTGHKDSTVAGAPQYSGSYESGSVEAVLYTGQYTKPGSGTYGGDSTRLNRAASADLDVSVKSSAQIGAQRLGLHTVTIKNNGPSTAKNVWLTGSHYKLVGSFEPTLLSGNCTGVVVSSSANCAIGDIESGKSATITMPVLGAKKLGTIQVTTYEVGSSELDANDDNNAVAHTQTVVKASLAPLTGVKLMKQKGANIAQVAKKGLSTTVTCPGACVVKSELQVSRKVAERLGLVKPRKATRRAKAVKAPLPYIVVGVGTKKITKSGKVVVTAKFSKKYKAKITKLRTSLTVNRVVTVKSNDKLTKGATYMKGQNVVLKASKAKKPRR